MSVIDRMDAIGRAPGGRKLIAVMCADMVGYSRLIELDDLGTLERLRVLRRALIDPAVNEHGGRIVQTAGDSLLVVFDSIDGAIRCAVTVQRQVPHHDGDRPADQTIRFRIGINIGEAIANGTDLHGEVVNVAARLEAICPPEGICVTRAVRDHVHGHLDLLFEELGALSLKNISRPIEAFLVKRGLEPIGWTQISSAPPGHLIGRTARPPRLSAVVAPFRSLDAPQERASLVEAITDDLATDLSQLPGSFVVGGAEALSRVGDSSSPRDIARELGVVYLIQGSIRSSVDNIRVNVQLIDVETGAHLWAERFDLNLGGIIDAHKEIAGRLGRTLSVRLIEDVNRRIEGLPQRDWSPYDLIMRGRAFASRPLSKANRHEAMNCFDQALARDAGSVDARVGIALVLIANVADGWSPSADRDLVRAEQLLRDVLHIDGGNLQAHTWMGMLRRLEGRLEESKIEFEIAIGLAPDHAIAISQLGLTLAYLGHPEAGAPLIEKSIRLAPHDPGTPISYLLLGICQLLLDNVQEAIVCLLKSRVGNPRIWSTHYCLAAALGLKGEMAEAAAALRQAIEIRPEMNSISALRALPSHVNPKFITLFERSICTGLRRAGMPDE